MSEIKIRNVPKGVVAFFDEKAKARGISREEILREQLKFISLDNEIKKVQERETIIVNKLIKVIELNTKVMKAFLEENCISFEEVFEDE